MVKTRSGPKSWKAEKAKFGSIKPNASSPPPMATVSDAMTEEQESNAKISSEMETATDVANMSDFSVESTASMRTTASGATKRAKRTASSESKKRRKRQKNRGFSTSDEEEEEEIDAPVEKRGRKITTGEGVDIRAHRAARKDLRKLHKEKQELETILKGGYDAAEFKGERRAKKEEEMEEEMRNLPSRDIASQMTQAAKLVEMVASLPI